MLRRILFSLATITSTAASADEPNWVVVSRAESHAFVEFVDLNSLAMRYGRPTALFLTNYEHSQDDAAKPYQSVKALRMFDCSAQRVAAVAMTRFADRGGRGEVIDSQSRTPAAVHLARSGPDSVGQAGIELVCSLWEKRRALPSAAPSPTSSKPVTAPLRGALS
jgi:hypothetical protein